ncbi:MAG: hypothetical protein A3E31_03770 [Candidatus Rokubacteria bacterium RIFCSPHIGHO2_12_FULL_73_22]|nr:MAG: hypothetical protein A3E31_03770 [Candidatus Rokubacteria bacterium RIFCSPHIGHO2_12_FULL_73_22]
MCGWASQRTRITPGFVSRRVMSIIWSLVGSARLNTVGFPRNPCVLCRIASEFLTRTRSPGATAVTWPTNRQPWLSRITSAPPFLPRVTRSSSTTPPRTPPSGPTTSASEGARSPQTSRFLLTGIGSGRGGVPAKRSAPCTTPPSTTATAS